MSVSYTGDATMDEPALRDVERTGEGRQADVALFDLG